MSYKIINLVFVNLFAFFTFPTLLWAQCPAGMEQVESFCGTVCEGDTNCAAVLPNFLVFLLEIDWGMQEAVILVGCDDDVTPAKGVVKQWSQDDVVEDYEMWCAEYDYIQTTDVTKETTYQLQAVFDGSIFKVNGSTNSPVNICSPDDIEATLINNDPETIRRSRDSEILIMAKKYKTVTPEDCCHELDPYDCCDYDYIYVTFSGINNCGSDCSGGTDCHCADLNGTWQLSRSPFGSYNAYCIPGWGEGSCCEYPYTCACCQWYYVEPDFCNQSPYHPSLYIMVQIICEDTNPAALGSRCMIVADICMGGYPNPPSHGCFLSGEWDISDTDKYCCDNMPFYFDNQMSCVGSPYNYSWMSQTGSVKVWR